LILADVTRDAARRAAQLRVYYDIRLADALQVATTLLHRGTAFFTNDRRLKRLASEVEIIVLEDHA
jgi:predicted nucleic acid-binding protein